MLSRLKLISLIALVVLMTSCTSYSQETITTIVETQSIAPSNAPSTVSSTPLPITTVTQIPTLNSIESDKVIRQSLLDDDPCLSPCIFGIIPGETALEDAKRIYKHLNLDFKLTYDQGGIRYYETRRGFEDGLGVVALHVVEQGFVQSMSLGVTNSNRLINSSDILAYNPKTLISKYGTPSSVEFLLSFPAEAGFPPDTAWYTMILYHEEVNIIALYSHGLVEDKNQIKICPMIDDFRGFGIWMGLNPHNQPNSGISLESAASATVNEFSNLMLGEPAEACLNLDAKVFPP